MRASVASGLGLSLDNLPATLTDLVERAAGQDGSGIHCGTQRLGYDALPERVARLAGGLASWGVRPGDHVALWMRNRPEWLDVWFAVSRLNATLVPLNTRFSPAEAEYVLQQSQSRWLVREGAAGALDDEALNDMTRRGIALRGDAVLDAGPSAHGDVDFEELARGEHRASAESPSLVGMIQYTSGSTAFPKGAMLRNASLVRNGFGLGEAWQISPSDRVLCANPLFHCGGSVFAFLAGYTHGASIVLVDRWRVREMARLLRAEVVTVLPAIDAMVRDLLALVRSTGERFPTLRVVSTAADPELLRNVSEKLRCEVSNVYGLTESSPNVCVGDLRDSLEVRIATIGRPQPGLEVEIRDPDSHEVLPVGEVGAIVVRGWSLMAGYFDDPGATSAAIDSAGFLSTGDLGSLTADGYLLYQGRLKQMIKSGGENVSIEEVERVLRADERIADAVVVSAPDERFGEVGFAFVRLVEPGSVETTAIIERCRGSLAGFKVPKYVELVDRLPVTGSGKVDRRNLQDLARESVARGGRK